jgi:hypothetical protein
VINTKNIYEIVILNNLVWNDGTQFPSNVPISLFGYNIEENVDAYVTVKSSSNGLKLDTINSDIYVFDIYFEISGILTENCFYVAKGKTLELTHCYISLGTDFYSNGKSLFKFPGNLLISGVIINVNIPIVKFEYDNNNKYDKSNIRWNGFTTYADEFIFKYDNPNSISSLSNCQFEALEINKTLIYIEENHELSFTFCNIFNVIVKNSDAGIFYTKGNLTCANCSFSFCHVTMDKGRGGVFYPYTNNTIYVNFTDGSFISLIVMEWKPIRRCI